MTKHPTLMVIGAAALLSAVVSGSYAQDDLDDLLKDLEGSSAKPAESAKPAAEPPAAEPAPAEAPAAEEPAPAPAVAVAVEPAPEEPAPAPAEEPAAPAPETPAVAEAPAAEPAPAAVEAPAPAAVEEPAPAVAAAESAPAAVEAPAVVEALAAESAARPVADAEASAPAPARAAAAPAPVRAAAPAVAPDPDAELLENIRSTERLRRTARDAQAKKEIAEARAAMKSGDFAEAVKHYNHAKVLLDDAPASKAFIRECEQGVAEGLYRHALKIYSEFGERKKAIRLMEVALDSRHPKARAELEKWRAEEAEAAAEQTEEAGVSRQRISEADYKADRDQIRRHLRRSRQFLAVRDMKRALEECEVVLVMDPYNQDAIRIRGAIQRKRQTILQQERVASRDGIIADVDAAWRPPYAVNVAQLADRSAETVKSQQGDSEETTVEQDIEKRMKDMRLPTISFKPPATIIDAVDFFRGASRDYDRPDIPLEKRGFNFVLRTPQGAIKGQQHAAEGEGGGDDFSSSGNEEENSAAPANGLDPIPTITASDVSFHEALTLVCESVGYKFIINGPIVMVMPKDMSTAEILSRKYNVPESFMERVSSATDEMKQMGGSSFGGGQKKSNDSEEESPERDWKAFFEEMGVKWPEGSSIKHIKSLGKLYVRNTRENLAEFEKVLEELGGQPQLIEIETRFVEVSQEDLNSLGFEWILNSDYSLNLGNTLGKALGVKPGVWGNESGSVTTSRTGSNATYYDSLNREANQQSQEAGFPTSWARRTEVSTADSMSSSYSHTVSQRSSGGTWTRWRDGDNVSKKRALGINAFGGTSEQQNGNRYLSTLSNHISGESKSTNDQFMRVNAFLGQADLSMILHMLSQRSDTDLLSAPKVVTKSGENAVIKVVTEYIYPQDYDVQLQSSGGGSSSSSSSGGSSAILAVVEPQNFTMREVGVILDVTPTYSEANGGTIDLELKPQVVDEPTWRNYGMKIPFSGNSSVQNFTGLADIPLRAVEAIQALGGTISDEAIQSYSDAIMDASTTAMAASNGAGNMTWYDAPMEQPFFHVRSIDSKVSITPGATVVMGGLITEQRKAMDDKIPFLGDLPYIGRLFRSHAEQTIKRNLLIFVTGRLITPAGRELRIGEETAGDEAEVKPAPEE